MVYITFNEDYVLKPDEGRSLILARLLGRNRLKGIEDSFTNVIHPIFAMILSFMDGREKKECIADAAKELGVSEELIESFVSKLIDNPSQIFLKTGNVISAFPPYSIVTIPQRETNRRFSADMFSYSSVDVRMKRHSTPSTITLMVNNICSTNCIYCYQDKTRRAKCRIPLDRIYELIREARLLNVNTFDVMGGEFFLYKHWKEVLKELKKNGYNPYISTKKPLPERDIKFLSEKKLMDIQISFDTAIKPNIVASLGVKPDYVDKMVKSIHLLDKYGIPIMFHTVLTQYNQTVQDMESVYNIIKGVRNLIDWHVVKGDESLYPKAAYNTIEIGEKGMNDIADYLSKLKREGFPVRFPEKTAPTTAIKQAIGKEIQIKNFFERSFCSGLFSSLYILPDGNVTMCEQLYWNKDFIVGNILHDSIMDVWNSPKALSLFNLKQENIPEDSLCNSCQHYNECRSVRQICYRETIRKYGKDKWFYPDANCPFSD